MITEEETKQLVAMYNWAEKDSAIECFRVTYANTYLGEKERTTSYSIVADIWQENPNRWHTCESKGSTMIEAMTIFSASYAKNKYADL